MTQTIDKLKMGAWMQPNDPGENPNVQACNKQKLSTKKGGPEIYKIRSLAQISNFFCQLSDQIWAYFGEKSVYDKVQGSMYIIRTRSGI